MDLDCIKKKEQLEAKDISFGDRDFSEVDIKSMEVELEKKCSEIADLQKYLLEEFQNIYNGKAKAKRFYNIIRSNLVPGLTALRQSIKELLFVLPQMQEYALKSIMAIADHAKSQLAKQTVQMQTQSFEISKLKDYLSKYRRTSIETSKENVSLTPSKQESSPPIPSKYTPLSVKLKLQALNEIYSKPIDRDETRKKDLDALCEKIQEWRDLEQPYRGRNKEGKMYPSDKFNRSVSYIKICETKKKTEINEKSPTKARNNSAYMPYQPRHEKSLQGAFYNENTKQDFDRICKGSIDNFSKLNGKTTQIVRGNYNPTYQNKSSRGNYNLSSMDRRYCIKQKIDRIKHKNYRFCDYNFNMHRYSRD